MSYLKVVTTCLSWYQKSKKLCYIIHPFLHFYLSSDHVLTCSNSTPRYLYFRNKNLQPNRIKIHISPQVRIADLFFEFVIDQFRYIKIQPKTIDLSTRLRGINSTNSAVIPRSFVLRCIVLGWILIYRNWSTELLFLTWYPVISSHWPVMATISCLLGRIWVQ